MGHLNFYVFNDDFTKYLWNFEKNDILIEDVEKKCKFDPKKLFGFIVGEMTSTSERKPSLTINDCSTNLKEIYIKTTVFVLCFVSSSKYLLHWFLCLPFESFIIRISDTIFRIVNKNCNHYAQKS